MNEFISIVLPTYNRAHRIRESIDSILQQSYTKFELIIIDDKSTDNTFQIINEYKDSRIKYFRLEKNIGAAAARNFGIKKSAFEIIAFQDSDDFWHPDKLKIQYECIKDLPEQYALVYCSLRRNYSSEKVIPPKNMSGTSGYIYKKLKKINFISTQTILSKKSAILSVNGFDENLPAFQDWDLVLRISKRFKIKHIKKSLVILELSNDSITKNRENALKALKYMLEKYREELSNSEKKIWYYYVAREALILNKLEEALYFYKKSINIYSKKGLISIIKSLKILFDKLFLQR